MGSEHRGGVKREVRGVFESSEFGVERAGIRGLKEGRGMAAWGYEIGSRLNKGVATLGKRSRGERGIVGVVRHGENERLRAV